MSFGLPRGVFTLSLDFELVWGSRDLEPNTAMLERQCRVTREQVFSPLLTMLDDLGIRATWATVGHLFMARSRPDVYADQIAPTHTWLSQPWFSKIPRGDEHTSPAWFGRSLVQRLIAAGQEVGSHSFSHPIFGDPGCSRETADADLARVVAEAQELGLKLKSFVFPRNVPGHVDLLRKHGFTCWRPPEPAWYRRAGLPHAAGRALHLAEVVAAAVPPTVLPSRDEHGLWCVPGSAVFLPADGIRRVVPISRRVQRSQAGTQRAARRREIFHLYIHPINFASAPGPMLAGFREVLEHAARLRDRGELDILSMGDIAERCEAQA